MDEREFGRMQAEIQGLRRDNDEQMKMLKELVDDVRDIRMQLSEAKGGWKLFVAMGSVSAALGALVASFLPHAPK
jgi:hypothetical protein